MSQIHQLINFTHIVKYNFCIIFLSFFFSHTQNSFTHSWSYRLSICCLPERCLGAFRILSHTITNIHNVHFHCYSQKTFFHCDWIDNFYLQKKITNSFDIERNVWEKLIRRISQCDISDVFLKLAKKFATIFFYANCVRYLGRFFIIIYEEMCKGVILNFYFVWLKTFTSAVADWVNF